MAAMSQHADPNPYGPISTRIDAFLRLTLIPNLLKSDAGVKGLVGKHTYHCSSHSMLRVGCYVAGVTCWGVTVCFP